MPTETPAVEHMPSLRTWLVALPLICIVPAAVLVSVLIFLDYQRGRDEVEANTLGTARALAAVVDRQASQVRAGLEGLATSPLLQQGLVAQFHEQASRFQRSQSLALNVVLVDPAGTQVVNTLLPQGTELPGGRGPRPVMEVFTRGGPVVTDLFAGEVARRNLVAIGVPVYDGPRIIYALSAGIDPSSIGQVLQRQHLPPGWIAVVLDSSGTIVARTDLDQRYIGQKASPDLLRHMRDGNEGAFDGLTKEGIEVRSVFSHSPGTGWVVAIGIPRKELETPLVRSLAWLGAATLLLLAASLTMAWRLGARLADSVAQLVTASVQLGRGEAVEVPRLAFEEANHLARSMAIAGLTLRHASEDAEANAARLAAVLESAMDAIVVVDEANRIVTFNAAASRLFRYFPEEAIGTDFDRLFPQPLRGHRKVWLRELPDNGSRRLEPARGERLTGLTREGRLFPIEASVSKAVVRGVQYLVMFVRAAAS